MSLIANTQPLFRAFNAAIQVLNELFTKLTWRYLIDYDSHFKDCISCIEYIRNMMILRDKKTLVSKQFQYWFFKVLRLCCKQGLRISTASCGVRKTN